jgi:hypothetical protein
MSPGGPYEKIEGSGIVRRLFSAFVSEADEDTPAIRRMAPRNASVIFMMFMPARIFGDSRLDFPIERKPDIYRTRVLARSFPQPIPQTENPRRNEDQ